MSSAPLWLWLQGFMLRLRMCISMLASVRRELKTVNLSTALSKPSSEASDQVMWPVQSSSQEISRGTLKSVLKHLI